MSIYWRKRLGLSASALAVGLVAAALVPGTARATPDPFHASAASLENIQKSWAYVPEYASAPALASGRLTDPRGSAMAGATIIVFPVPKSPKAGATLTPVARATTSANGDYTLHLPATARPLLLGPRSNVYMNMQIIAFYPDAAAIWFVPIKPGAKEVPSANLVLRQLPPADAAASARPAAQQVVPYPPNGGACTGLSNTEIPNVPEVVGYKSTGTASHINYAQITYSSTVDQSSGVGFSLSGAKGGFSVSGTTETTSDINLPYPKISGASSNYMTAYTLWNKAYIRCTGTASNPPFYAYEVYLNSVSTPDSTPGAEPVSAGKCSLGEAGVPITYDTTSQETWSTGVNISGYIGINLSSQDGWTTSTSLVYDLAVTAPICGVHNYPNANNPSAGYLVVH
jgi:hypothetical protein